MSNLEVHTYPLGAIDTNAFLVLNKESKKAILIDAPDNSYAKIADELTKHECKLTAVIITHGHWDHIGEVAAFQKEGVPVYAHKGDQEWIENPAVFGMFMPPGAPAIEPITINHFLEHGQETSFLGEPVEIRHVPGHAPGNILIFFKNFGWAFVGDVIFAGSVGRYDLPGSNGKDLIRSIKEQVYTLPDDTVLYTGHGPDTTVGAEKATNPFVQGE